MAIIFETSNFIITSAEKPHVYIDRDEGGHINLKFKREVRAVHDRTQLSALEAIEYIKLSMIAGEALKNAMHHRGVNVGLVNYQDMGNWSVFKPEGPQLHTQIYGRAATATIQKYGDAVQLPHIETGFYDSFQPLTKDDVEEIRLEIEKIMQRDKYNTDWSESQLR